MCWRGSQTPGVPVGAASRDAVTSELFAGGRPSVLRRWTVCGEDSLGVNTDTQEETARVGFSQPQASHPVSSQNHPHPPSRWAGRALGEAVAAWCIWKVLGCSWLARLRVCTQNTSHLHAPRQRTSRVELGPPPPP